MKQRKHLKALFVGIDGATDDVMGPMMRRGDLPNIAALRARGAYGPLKSQAGYSSPALWASIESGYRPETHGILGFPTALRGNLRKPRIHERLARSGWKVGMCRMFSNWPPGENEVFVVPSFADVATEAHPAWVAPLCRGKALRRPGEMVRYLYHVWAARLGVLGKVLSAGVSLRKMYVETSKAYFRAQNAQHWLYLRLFKRLVTEHRPDYAALLIGMADSVGHRYWRFHHERLAGEDTREARRLGGVVERAYTEIDLAVGELLELVDDDTRILLVSDHGMEFVDRSGEYLTPKSDFPRVLQLPDRVEAYFSGVNVYLALPSDCGETRDLLPILQKTTLQADGTPFFKTCHMSGERVRLSIDRSIRWEPSALVKLWNGRTVPIADIARREPRRSGDHGEGPDGIVLFVGPGVRPGCEIPEAKQFDIAPTMLSLLGEPVPADCEGSPLAAVLEPEVVQNVREVRDAPGGGMKPPITRSDEEEAELMDRLRGLGYVD